MREKDRITLQVTANVDEIRQKINVIEKKLEEASALIQELASCEISVDFEVER